MSRSTPRPSRRRPGPSTNPMSCCSNRFTSPRRQRSGARMRLLRAGAGTTLGGASTHPRRDPAHRCQHRQAAGARKDHPVGRLALLFDNKIAASRRQRFLLLFLCNDRAVRGRRDVAADKLKLGVVGGPRKLTGLANDPLVQHLDKVGVLPPRDRAGKTRTTSVPESPEATPVCCPGHRRHGRCCARPPARRNGTPPLHGPLAALRARRENGAGDHPVSGRSQ